MVEIRPECAGRRRSLSQRMGPLFLSQQVDTSKENILMEHAVHRALNAPVTISAGVLPGASVFSGGTMILSPWGRPQTAVYGQVRSNYLKSPRLAGLSC